MTKRPGPDRRRYHGSRILRDVHETAKASYLSGVIDSATMNEFDAPAPGLARHLASMPNVGKDQDFAREQTDRRSSSCSDRR